LGKASEYVRVTCDARNLPLIGLNAGVFYRSKDGRIVPLLRGGRMKRRTFLTGAAIAGFATALDASGALAQGMNSAERDQMRKRWDEMDHDSRVQAMDRMRGRRHEPKYEEMRERWDKLTPEQRSGLIERHRMGARKTN